MNTQWIALHALSLLSHPHAAYVYLQRFQHGGPFVHVTHLIRLGRTEQAARDLHRIAHNPKL